MHETSVAVLSNTLHMILLILFSTWFLLLSVWMKVYKLFGVTVQMKPIPFSAFYKLKLGKFRLNYDSGHFWE